MKNQPKRNQPAKDPGINEVTKEEPKVTKDMSLLTPVEQKILKHVRSAPKDPPRLRVTEIQENFDRIAMEVPKGISRGPEFTYGWLSIAKLDAGDYEGGKWAVVSRSNHAHVKENQFSLAEGGIVYGGQNILAFCYTETLQEENRLIEKEYNSKTDKQIKNEGAAKIDASVVDEKSMGRVVNENLTVPDEDDDDFEAPQ